MKVWFLFLTLSGFKAISHALMMNVIEQKSLVSTHQTKFNDKLRNATRARM